MLGLSIGRQRTKRGVGALIRTPLNLAGCRRLSRGAGEDGMLEGLAGLVASRAGRAAVVVPCRVGTEVALPRSRLVLSSRVELVETQEQVGFEWQSVQVSNRV